MKIFKDMRVLAAMLVCLLTGAGGTYIGLTEGEKETVEVVGEAAGEVLDGLEGATGSPEATKTDTDPAPAGGP